MIMVFGCTAWLSYSCYRYNLGSADYIFMIQTSEILRAISSIIMIAAYCWKFKFSFKNDKDTIRKNKKKQDKMMRASRK